MKSPREANAKRAPHEAFAKGSAVAQFTTFNCVSVPRLLMASAVRRPAAARPRSGLAHCVDAQEAKAQDADGARRPRGTGYLQKLLRDPRSGKPLDVSALSRFAQVLKQGQRSRRALRRSARAMLLEAQEHPSGVFRNTLRMPGTIAEPMARLALQADVPISAVASALLSYGLEMLANEVRKWNVVPAPHLPTQPLVAESLAASGALKIV